MRRILVIVYSAFLVIMLVNYFYYKNLYDRQTHYIVELLDRQVQIVGLSVDSTNSGLLSDLNEISTSDDLTRFFTDPVNCEAGKVKLKLLFSKYQDFITGIKLRDSTRNEFSLKKDSESGEWLEQTFILHIQAEIFSSEKLVQENRKFEYYKPVNDNKNNKPSGNLVITIDYQKYFSQLFSVFDIKNYQWQWIVNSSGEIIFDNKKSEIDYLQLKKIAQGLAGKSFETITHKAIIDGKKKGIISSYYHTQLLQREFGLVFSSPTDLLQKFIIRNSLLIVLVTLLLIQLIIFVFWQYIKTQGNEIKRLNSSEKMLYKLIEEMPVGVIIHNKNREILKANKVAASQYSYLNEEDMKGKIFPETSLQDGGDYFLKNLGGTFNPDQFVIIKKEIGEIVLFRNSIPAFFMGEEATMEILIDVTMLESARKKEAKANVAKSEFLARMSYEIRTPLNGIIGITDVLIRYKLPDEVKEIVSLLHRSTEVLLSIINDILDFSRIESGKMILDEVPFNLRDEINYSTNLAMTYITDNDLSLVSTVDDNVPESIIGDPFRLRQVLSNLISHSIKSTEKGEIRLNCMIKSTKNGIITLGFELLDTGMSFDKASLKKIFGDFVNIESKIVRTRDESGFGTILAKQLVELMGGELTAESPSGLPGGLGTKVSFTILTYSNNRPIKNISQDNIRTFDKIKTLVITGNQGRDDEILSNFRKLGLNVSITTFLKSTVKQIKTNINDPGSRYNLIVIFNDKDFDGFDVANLLWENNLSSSFIIFMISSNDKKGNYMKCISMGIDHYLVKPFDINELQSTIRTYFPSLIDSSFIPDIGRARRDLNILIVEDNKMNQKVIGTMLKSIGYTFDIVDDGYSGFLQAKSKKYDLILMDLIMPEMDGYESAQKMLEYDKSLLIVAFTADNMPESRKKAELAGIKDFIFKPVRIDELKKLFVRYFTK
jgi:signal transduction histidine kinase/CheY-like chemotaxis protein